MVSTLDTLLAQACESKNTVLYATAVHLLSQMYGGSHTLHINDSGTIVADEVAVGIGVTLEAFHSIHNTHGADESLLLEHGKIAVHRTQGEVGDLWLELCIYPLGSGMGRSGADTF